VSGYRLDDEWSNTDMYGERLPSGWKQLTFAGAVIGLAAVIGQVGHFTFTQVAVALFTVAFFALPLMLIRELRKALRSGYFGPMRGNPYRIYRSSSPITFRIYVVFFVLLVPACTAIGLFLAFCLYAGVR
jgi:hypothetical protein